MSRPLRQWQRQALSAQRRDNEIKKAEERQQVASYFKKSTIMNKQHEQWMTEEYIEKVKKEAELLKQRKIRDVLLEERRKKLETMLFQENIQIQKELKALAKQPKFYKNGSYLNKVPTSNLNDINMGIIAKEQELRKQEAELKLHHAWRMRQPELRATDSYVAGKRLKSAWMEQIVEKELEKRKEAEKTRKHLDERDKVLREQIEAEQQKMWEKKQQMKELRNSLEGQIAEISNKESAVKILRTEEERERILLDKLQFILCEREKELERLVAERDATIINMGLHKYKLKKKVASIMKEIELDLEILDMIRTSILQGYEDEQQRVPYKRVLDEAFLQLEEYRVKEKARQKNIETMYDGEARQINEKQDKLWALECKVRSVLMNEVICTLKKQIEDKIEENRNLQKANVKEREEILEQMDNFHQEVRSRERSVQLQNSTHSTITNLQSQLNGLRLQKQQISETEAREAEMRQAVEDERNVRHEVARAHWEGSTQAWA